MDNTILLKSTKEIGLAIAENYKKLRKSKKISQIELASKSGMSLGTLKRFEKTGEISLYNLIQISNVLGNLDAFDNLLVTKKEYKNIQEVINERKRINC